MSEIPTSVTIRKLKGNRGYVVCQGQEWRVEARTFEQAAKEALHYGMMYDAAEVVEAAILMHRKYLAKPLTPHPRRREG